jgi:hypothetical protein
VSLRSTILAVVGSALVVPAAEAADAPSLRVGLRLQGWYVAEQNGAPDGSTAHDFLLRRGYLSVTGKLTSTVSAFVHVSGDRIGQAGLDAPGLGLGTGVALRDAWVAWAPHPALRVQAGRMYVPFTRAYGTESTFTLLGLDLPQSQGGGRGAIFYPSKVGRDDGVVAWGGPLGGRVQYRLGVLQGVEGAMNPGASLRLSGRASVNLLEAETGWFNRGTYLGEKRVLAIGAGFDRQPGLVLAGAPDQTYRAWTADAFLDHPLGRGALTVEASYTDAHSLPAGLSFAGIPAGGDARIAYLQGGYLLPWPLGSGRIQAYCRGERIFVTAGDDTTLPSAGINYLIRGQDLKVTVDWSRASSATRPASSAVTLQAQVGF